jgi:hypothetical protein
MEQFFSIYTLTPWDNLSGDVLSHVKLLSLKSVLNKYPVIDSSFFDDLRLNLHKRGKFSTFNTIKRIVGPNKEDYDIRHWLFIWAMDNQKRMFQFLIQEEKVENETQFIMVALAPPEIGKLFADYGKDAIVKTLSLLNDSNKIKFLILLKAKGKSIAEDAQSFKFNQAQLNKLKFVEELKNIPNLKGQWFPTFEPKCPRCNTPLIDVNSYQIGLGTLICPKCGYEIRKYV